MTVSCHGEKECGGDLNPSLSSSSGCSSFTRAGAERPSPAPKNNPPTCPGGLYASRSANCPGAEWPKHRAETPKNQSVCNGRPLPVSERLGWVVSAA